MGSAPWNQNIIPDTDSRYENTLNKCENSLTSFRSGQLLSTRFGLQKGLHRPYLSIRCFTLLSIIYSALLKLSRGEAGEPVGKTNVRDFHVIYIDLSRSSSNSAGGESSRGKKDPVAEPVVASDLVV